MNKFMILFAATAMFCGCNLSSGNKTDGDSETALKIADSYDYVIGTQTMAARYKFTDKSALVETAERIMEMGSNIIKFSINPLTADPELQAWRDWMPLDLAKSCNTIKTVLDMPFKYTLLWVTTPGVEWNDGLTEDEKQKEFDSMYSFTEYLLKNYKGTGRNFYLGHWEGDWLLMGHYDNTIPDIPRVRIQGMIDWYKVRQAAVEKARSDVESDVRVYNYAEVNRVTPSLYKDFDRMANRVIPEIDVDYVSYSSYESIVEEVSGADYAQLKDYLFKSLDYIEKQMKPKSGIEGRRVFIGEFGYPYTVFGKDPGEQCRRTVNVLKASIEWGCPFCLYWEMYDNEGDDKGYWMIDSKNEKQPVYFKYESFYKEMHDFVYEYALKEGEAPSYDIFRKKALEIL